MAVWSEVTCSNVDVKSRIVSEYFSPKYVENDTLLSRVHTKSLPQLFKVSDGNHLEVSHHFTENINDVPYFRGKDITNFFIVNSTPIRIPYSVYNTNQMRRSHFQAGDVLLSIVGTIGSLSIVPDTLGDSTGSCKIAILRAKGSSNPFFLAAFLFSKFGQQQIRRNTRGAVQMGLILKDLALIKIPIVLKSFENKIEHLVKGAIKSNSLSHSLYTQAQELLENELGLDKLKFEKPVGYETSFSEVMEGRRVDAQCYKPEHVSYEHYLRKNCNFEYLKSIVFSPVKGKQMTALTNGPVSYASIKDIDGTEVITDSFCSLISETRVADQYDLLLAITGATIGKVGIIERHKRLAFSGDLLALKVKDTINAYYLLAVLQSSIGQSQCQRWITGSTNGHLAPNDVLKIVIPRLDSKIEKKISSYVEKSLSTKSESQQLLEQAKTRVEQLIEEAAEKNG